MYSGTSAFYLVTKSGVSTASSSVTSVLFMFRAGMATSTAFSYLKLFGFLSKNETTLPTAKSKNILPAVLLCVIGHCVWD